MATVSALGRRPLAGNSIWWAIPLMLGAPGAFGQGHGQLLPLGMLPGGSYSIANGTSDDGGGVTGWADDSNGADRAVVWLTNGGIRSLGTLNNGVNSYASGVSADGGVVVGYSQNGSLGPSSPYFGFRWTQAGGMVSLGTLAGGADSYAMAVSADGRVIVGNATTTGPYNAFRWTQAGGMVALGTVAGDTDSGALAVNQDGTVIAGYSGNANSIAARWTQAGGWQSLGLLPGAYTISMATGVSRDGSVVVGTAFIVNGISTAFRWTQAGGLVALTPAPGGTQTQANAVSGDGQVVVGYGDVAGGFNRAIRWTQAGGTQTVDNWLRENGVTLPNDITNSANGTNNDGSIVVGTLNTLEAFIARRSGLITPVTFNPTVAEATQAPAQTALNRTELALSGAHHRPLKDNGLVLRDGEFCGWGTADAATDSRRDSRQYIAEAGVCRDLAQGRWRVGAGLGYTQSRQSFGSGGNASGDSRYLFAEADYAPNEHWIASVTAFYDDGQSRIRRNYLNGGQPDASVGRPDANTWALRARFDWLDAVTIGDFRLAPFVSLTRIDSELAAYTETGGGFPVSVDSQRQVSNEARLGAAAVTRLSAATTLRGTFESARHFGGSASGVNGRVVGLYAFSFPGTRPSGHWQRLGVEIDHQVGSASLLSVSANIASRNGAGDPDSALSIGWKTRF